MSVSEALGVTRSDHTGDGLAAEAGLAEAGALFVGERDDPQRMTGDDAALLDHPAHFERPDHSNDAVEPPAVRDRVEVRAEGQERPIGAARALADRVAERVHAGREAGRAQPLGEQSVGLALGLGERQPTDHRAPVAADLAELLNRCRDAARIGDRVDAREALVGDADVGVERGFEARRRDGLVGNLGGRGRRGISLGRQDAALLGDAEVVVQRVAVLGRVVVGEPVLEGRLDHVVLQEQSLMLSLAMRVSEHGSYLRSSGKVSPGAGDASRRDRVRGAGSWAAARPA